MPLSRDIVITGIGPILPGCDDRDTFWRQVRDGESQLTMEPDPCAAGERIPLGLIKDFNPRQYLRDIPGRLYHRFVRAQQLYLASLARACDDAGLASERLRSDRVGLFDGTSRDNIAVWQSAASPGLEAKHALAAGMGGMGVCLGASLLGVRGPTYTFVSSCASGVVAMGHALRELQLGEIDVALSTGHDAILPTPVLRTFRDAGLLNQHQGDARQALRPYGGSRNVFGEGAVTMALETRAHAEARGAHVLARLAGYRYGNGGDHPTRVDESGERPATLIEEALERSGVSRDEVGFVLGHGNGVAMSDRSELEYMRRVFGERVHEVPLISTKPIYGHTLGASGVVNAAAAALMLRHQRLIPTINVDETRPYTDVTHQAGRGAARRCEAGVVVCFGIGGQNAVLVLRRDQADGL